MQPTETYSTPRRALDVEDYIDILRRHKGWIFGPFLLTLVASVVGVFLWPNSYESTAVIKITQQQIPQNMVQSSITPDMIDQINTIRTTVLSRNVLTLIINNFDLYKRERDRLPMDDVVENIMRPAIHTDPLIVPGNGRNVPAFTVQFKYYDRLVANRVVQELVSRFINTDVSARSTATMETSGFLKDEMDQAKKDLDAREEKLTQFRAQNAGRLPDQMDQNVRQLTTLQTTYQSLASSKSRAEMEKMSLETELGIAKANKDELTRTVPAMSAAAQKSEQLLGIERDIRNLQDGLSLARQKYTDAHPEVQAIRSQLEVAQNRRQDILKEDEAARAEAKKNGAPAVVENLQTRMQVSGVEGNIKRLESAIAAKDVERAQAESQIKTIQTQIDRLQAQLSTAPLGQQQYSELLRERDLARDKYVTLNTKWSSAQIAQNLEQRGQGQKLEPLDAPTVPLEPSEPKRPQVIAMGAGLGLLLGIVIAAVREMKDTSLKNLKDVRAYTEMAILGSVPLLENDFVVRRRRRMAWLGWTTACLTAVVTMAVSVVYYYSSKV